MAAIAIIPARLDSTRLHRKLLRDLAGKPVLQRTWETVQQASGLQRVIVATDCDEIARVAKSFGAQVAMTGRHACGTDRVAEVARRTCEDDDIVVNLQGDEAGVTVSEIEKAVETALAFPAADMTTLATRLETAEQFSDPSFVKVVFSSDFRALYFSRSPIPYRQESAEYTDGPLDCPYLHIGIYVFRCRFLQRLTQSPSSRLEKIERLEQLRALELGADVRVALVDTHLKGIDTQADLERLRRTFAAK